MTTYPTVAEVVAALEARYPPRWADDGDAIGLIVGEPAATVERIVFAVDPVQAVVDEAIKSEADLIVVHHPLLYRAVSTVSADRPKGKAIHDLISHGIALYVAHTNADSPRFGVSESMALALGLQDLQPLVADPADPLDKVVTFVPTADAQKMIDALSDAGAGAIGDYDRCAFVTPGRARSVPGLAPTPPSGDPVRSRSSRRRGSRWCCHVVAVITSSRRSGLPTHTRSQPSTSSNWPHGPATEGVAASASSSLRPPCASSPRQSRPPYPRPPSGPGSRGSRWRCRDGGDRRRRRGLPAR